jgi:hypothetical protein
MAIEKIKVSLNFGTSKQEVGTLVAQNQLVYFRYAPSLKKSKKLFRNGLSSLHLLTSIKKSLS